VPVILYADLDGLKEINDSLGHQEGDRALVTAAELFKDTFRNADVVARLGGDEFVVLAAIDPSEEPETLTRRLQDKFSVSNKRRNRVTICRLASASRTSKTKKTTRLKSSWPRR